MVATSAVVAGLAAAFSADPAAGTSVAPIAVAEPLRNSRDELNLAEFPLALISDRVPAGLKTLVFEDSIRDQGTGEVVTRRLTISASDRYGLPTPADDDVIVALVYLTKQANGLSNRLVPFSRYQLLQVLGWPDKGQSYDRMEESLKRWLGVTLFYEKAWWDKEEQAWVDENFHILDNVTIYDLETHRKRRQKQIGKGPADLPLSSFAWNDVIFRSFQAENLKKLDLNVYFRLRLAPAKRMYRFLDKRFYRKHRWQFDLREFACEHIGFSRNYDNAQLRRKLQPSVEELEASGFLEPLAPEERYMQVRRGEWKVLFLKKADSAPEVAPRSNTAALKALVKELTTRGVTPAVAAEIIETHPAERIRVKLEVFDWLTENRDERATKNPAGYLVQSIRNDYVPPKGFEPKAEREARQMAAEEAKRKRKEADAKREADEKAKLEAETGRLDAYWKSLSASEQEKLRAEATAQASPWLREHAEKTSSLLAEAARTQIIHAHIRKLLDEQPAVQQDGQGAGDSAAKPGRRKRA